MSSPNVNLQDSFLNQVRKESILVEAMLVDGTSFQGTVRGFDNFTVIMNVAGKQHLVYKHAITQIVAPKLHRPPQGDGAPGRGKPTQQKHKNQKPQQQREAKKPEKFNALDLSSIKLEEGEASGPAESQPETAPAPTPQSKDGNRPEPAPAPGSSTETKSQPEPAPAPTPQGKAESQPEPEPAPEPETSNDTVSQPRPADTPKTSDEEAVKS